MLCMVSAMLVPVSASGTGKTFMLLRASCISQIRAAEAMIARFRRAPSIYLILIFMTPHVKKVLVLPPIQLVKWAETTPVVFAPPDVPARSSGDRPNWLLRRETRFWTWSVAPILTSITTEPAAPHGMTLAP